MRSVILRAKNIQGSKFTTIDINYIFYAPLMKFVNENLKKTLSCNHILTIP